MVVGRGAFSPPDNNKRLDPNFYSDAARVYITQKGHIDNSAGIADGILKDFMSSKDKSAILAKADHVRLMAREGIKIVTGNAKNSAGQAEPNSRGTDVAKVPKIEFIAGNYTEPDFLSNSGAKILQPLVKGDNLVEYLVQLQAEIAEVLSLVQANTLDLLNLFGVVAGITAVPAPPVSAFCVATQTAQANRYGKMMAQQQNLIALETNYLELGKGNLYINSGYVYTT
jgi:hypothetical protein